MDNTHKRTDWLKITDIIPERATPMLRQYLRAKAESGDSLLLFRMGDFYEMFFDDAFEASQILGIALTSRDGESKEGRIPMCGVPVKSINHYLARLIKAGKTVTICEQVEDPKLAKGVVKRAIVRTITPGTVLEPELLEEGVNNYLGALHRVGNQFGLALVDISTGEFLATRIPTQNEQILRDELTRLSISELLLPETVDESMGQFIHNMFSQINLRKVSDQYFDTHFCTETILRFYGLSTLRGLGIDGDEALIGSIGAVLQYITETQRDSAPVLRIPKLYSTTDYVVLDSNTQRNLELVQSLFDGSKHGSLLGVLDRTLTPMGSRKLRHWILHPLQDLSEIKQRLDAVEELKNNAEWRILIKEKLRGFGDLERISSRITANTTNPRDMKALADCLKIIPAIKLILHNATTNLLQSITQSLDELPEVVQWIESALVEYPPATISDGGIFRDGYHPQLDHLRTLMRGGKEWIAELQKKERERTGISNLKIGYNKVFGYYIEVSKGQTPWVPQDYIRKQTLVNAERYITPELKSREEEILTAEERSKALEEELYKELRSRIAQVADRILKDAESIALLDTLYSLAEIASSLNYCKPVVEETDEIEIINGRHPVVETLLAPGAFVPNDTYINNRDKRLMIITGPNMAGKSTYLRQVALIVLMAQIGSFVPAERARIGLVDRIYTRVGASDNLARGESTFMVEMIETANILNTATSRSLLILDEIGRGTSTYDGISIAWAVAEFIHDRLKARALFATHYHELTELAHHLPGAFNMNVAVREYKDRIVFLYRIFEGASDHSYGIHVAKLAGLPHSVIRRAYEVLNQLESGEFERQHELAQLPLFYSTASSPTQSPSTVEQELQKIDPDQLTPKDALDLLYYLKKLLNDSTLNQK